MSLNADEFLSTFIHLCASDARRGSRYVREMWAEVFPKYAKTPPPSVAMAKHAIFWKLKQRSGSDLIDAGKQTIKACIAASQSRPYTHYLDAEQISRMELADRTYGRMPK